MSPILYPHRKIFQYDSFFGYRFQSDIIARIPHEGGGYLLKTNKHGFRCKNINKEKKKNKRILVFGDSYTAGDGVSNRHRFTNEMENLLDDTEVMNFGLSGTGTDQQNLIFEHFAPQIDHDLIILVLQVENIKRNVMTERYWKDRSGIDLCVPKPWFELDDQNKLVLKGSPVNKPYILSNAKIKNKIHSSILRKILNNEDRKLKSFIQKLTRYQPLPEYRSANNQAWLITKELLKKIIAKSEKPVLVALLPVYQYVENTSSYAHIRKRFDAFEKEDKKNLIYHVIDDLLRYNLKERKSFRFKIDDHPTRSAHKAIGKSLASVVKPLLEKIK
tara:strand:- start:1361 stop:2353 length:993 start_codon:yes stop_codon:yes gene_type:complete